MKTQIDSAASTNMDGTVAKQNVYNLYANGILVGHEIPFGTLAASPDLLLACIGFVRQYEAGISPTLSLIKCKEAIAKATGGTK